MISRAHQARPSKRFAHRLAVALLAASVIAPACQRATESAEADFSAAKKREAARVLVEPLQRREMVRRLETTTRVESESQVQVFPRAGGVVVELSIEEGQPVTAGQVLARLDDRDARLRLDDARSQLADARASGPKLELATREAAARTEGAKRAAEQAQRDHERNLAISKGGPDSPGLISTKDLDASLLALDRARADLATALLAHERAKVEQQNGEHAITRAEVAVSRAELELSFTSLTAPVAGVVAERMIKLGDTVSSAAPAFALTDLTRLRAVFFRPQRELELFASALGPAAGADYPGAAESGGASARAELELFATAEALPGKRFPGRIERVAPTIDAASGNFRVTARLEGSSSDGRARLLPGMLVRLEIVTERRPDALVAPKRAIQREGDRSTIQVVEAGRAKSVEVLEGLSDDTYVEIEAREAGALAAGQLVIVVGNRDLENGAEVLATDATGAVLSAPVATDAESSGAASNTAAPSGAGPAAK